MDYLIIRWVATENGDNIKSCWYIKELLICQVPLGGSTDLSLFSWRNGFSRRPVVQVRPGFHLNKNENRIISGDNINFAYFAAIVYIDYRIPLFFQVFSYCFFTAFAPRRCRRFNIFFDSFERFAMNRADPVFLNGQPVLPVG